MSSARDEEASISDTDSSESEETSTAPTSVSTIRAARAASEDARNKLSMLIDSDDEEDEEEKKPKQQQSVLIKKRKVNSSLLSTNMAENTPTFSPSKSDKSDVIAKKKPKTTSSVPPDSSKSSTSVPIKESTEIKRITSRLGDTEWMEAELGEERLAAVSKAIDKIFEMSLNSDNFRLFGNDMIQCFYDVGTGTDIIYVFHNKIYYTDKFLVTGDPIRKKTLKYLEFLANRWKYTVMQEGWISNEDGIPTPLDIIDCIIGMYCMERVGIRHDIKAELLNHLETLNYSSIDYFGWDPLTQFPPDFGIEYIEISDNEDGQEENAEDETIRMWGMQGVKISKYRNYSNSLIHSFYADRIGLMLKCSYPDIFKWLPYFRPYKSLTELPYQDFIDQCYMITHIVFTNNNWGELQLHSHLYQHEYYFIRHYFMYFVSNHDTHLLSEFIECLRCFGCDDKDELIRIGVRTLLSLQSPEGLWDESEEPYRTYHATMCSSQVST